MAKKCITILAVVLIFTGIVSYLYAGDACKTYFTTCTEGGCASMDTAEACVMVCNSSNGTFKNVGCGEPAAEQ